MLDYEWGNPTSMNMNMMLSSSSAAAPGSDPPDLESTVAEDRHHIHAYDHYSFNDTTNFLSHSHHPPNLHHHFIPPPQFNSFYGGAPYSYPPPPPSSMLSLEPTNLPMSGGGGFLMVPKTEDFGAGSRIGLNLGGRTYFSSSEDDFVNRLYRRSKPAMEAGSVNSPRCQAEGCAADLTHAKHYHRRHKVCEFHSKASTVIAAGLTQRFCQQCSRFHLLSEFDNGKRSCRKRLADHNRRRRKSHQTTNENQKSQLDSSRNLSSDNLASSPPDSGAHSSSSVTVAISPPRMSLDCFPPRQYGAAASSSSSLFFSSG